MRARPVIGLVLADSTGGIGAHVGSLQRRLPDLGYDVRLVAPAGVVARLTGDRATPLPSGISSAVVELSTSPWAGALPARMLRRGQVRSLRDALAGVDLVHAHGLRAGRAALTALTRQVGQAAHTEQPAVERPARRPPGVPLVVTWHNPPPAGGPTGLAAGVAARRLARRCDLTLGASADLVELARQAGAPKVRLCEIAAPAVGGPPDPAATAALRAQLGAGTRPLVVTAGRLSAQKDHATLVGAAALLSARDPAPVIAIAGEGPERAALAARIAEQHLPVRLLGHRDDVATLLAAADVAVLSSRWEARSLFAQEALRTGVPLVVTAVGGLPDLVGDAALIVAPARPQQLADAISQILDLPGLRDRLRAAGPRIAAGWPTESDTAMAVTSGYRELLLLDS